jgi:AraC-like DNA-binding protein
MQRTSFHFREFRVLSSYALAYVVKGAGIYRDADGRESPVAAGDVILMFPGLGHAYGPTDGTFWADMYFFFEGPVFDLWHDAGVLDERRPIVRAEPVARWIGRFKGVTRKSDKGCHNAQLLQVCRLQEVLAEILGQSEPADDGQGDDRLIDAACAMLETQRQDRLNMRQIAQRLGVPFDTFRKRFAAVKGVSPARYRSERLMDAARSLMEAGRLSDKEISERLGFWDEAHFSRRFKAVVGMTPRAFRRDLLLRDAAPLSDEAATPAQVYRPLAPQPSPRPL